MATKKKRIVIVVGPPCAGKSTYIRANSKKGDILVDFDTIALAIGAENAHGSTGAIKTLGILTRNFVVDKVLEGVQADSWVIHTNPDKGTVDRYVKAGAEFVMLDPGEEECIERANRDDRPAGTQIQISRWYTNPPKLPEGTEEDKKAVRYGVICASIKKSLYRGTAIA